ncbi:MAG TPA: OB-fold domain-containing protein [Trebonia sp.]
MNMPPEELLLLPGTWHFDYTYFAGETASRFFAELRDNLTILGRRCPSCQRLVVPARSYCDACYLEMGGWEPVGETGTIEAFTILTAAFPGLPEPPLVIAFVTLDGADSAILNFVEGVDLSDSDAAGQYLFAHDRVRVVFSDKREGRITDFHFESISGS